jgi:RNA polymerase sigma factor (sigma-70 family)
MGTLSQEEVEYLYRGNPRINREARHKLIESNLGLVKKIANRYVGPANEFDDLFQVGALGLIKAVDDFDITRGVQLSTLVFTYVKTAIFVYLRKKSRHQDPLSLDVPIGDEINLLDILRADDFEAVYDQIIDDVGNDVIRAALKNLTRKEAKIVLLRYGFFGEIVPRNKVAELLGVSGSHVSCVEKKALVKLRHPRIGLRVSLEE